MTRPVDQLIDHAADLQRQVDQLGQEVLTLAVASLALGLGLLLLSWKLWHQ